MTQPIELLGNAILGILTGFDRIVFHGRLRNLQYSDGAQSFFDSQGILYKDAKNWMQGHTQQIISDAEQLSQRHCGRGLEPIRSTHDRKDEIARRRQQDEGIASGLIGGWTCVEECKTFVIRPAEGRPVLVPKTTRCNHIYLYIDHPTFGFMNVRLQTWFPYMLQVAINGREWLARQLQAEGVGFHRHRNKFIHVEDFARAQAALDHQAYRTDWIQGLNPFVGLAFPAFAEVLGQHHGYTWYTWQNEWATDYLFKDPSHLAQQMESILQQALLAGTSDRIMRFFDRATNQNGLLRSNAADQITTRFMHFGDGMRIRHWINGNSVKAYNQFNVLRVETTINNPGQFKTLRTVGNAEVPTMAPIRKTVCDMSRRARVANDVNQRFAATLQAAQDKTRIDDLFGHVSRRKTMKRRKVRALDPIGKDRELLRAIARPEFMIAGFTNRDIRAKLNRLPQYRGKTEKQMAGIVTRAIRLLRDHSLLRKLPNQHRYHLNDNGRKLTTALLAILQADIAELTKAAA